MPADICVNTGTALHSVALEAQKPLKHCSPEGQALLISQVIAHAVVS